MALERPNRGRQRVSGRARHLPTSSGHGLHEMLNRILAEAGFDGWVEELRSPHHAKGGRPGIPPGSYSGYRLSAASRVLVPGGASPGDAVIPFRCGNSWAPAPAGLFG